MTSTPQTIEQGFRLSPQQRRLWQLIGSSAKSPVARCAIDLVGELVPEALDRALAALVERHEILRTRLSRLPGMAVPLSVVDDALEPVATSTDLRGLDEADREPAAAAAWDTVGEPIGTEGPVVASRCLRLADDRHRLLLAVAPWSVDHAGLEVLSNQLAARYGAALGRGGTEAGSVRYAQFAAWQNQVVPAAPVADPRPAGPAMPFRLPPASWRPFEPAEVSVGRVPRLEPAEMLAVWSTALARYLGTEHVPVAERFGGRVDPALAHAVGVFEKWLPVDLEIDFGKGLAAAASRIAPMLAQVEANGAALMWPLRDAGGADAFPSFGLSAREHPALQDAGGVRFTPIRIEAQVDRCDLEWLGTSGPEGTTVSLRFDRGRHDPEDVAALARAVGSLLQQARKAPDRPLGSLPLLSAPARTAVSRSASPPVAALTHQRILDLARDPDQASRPAVTFEDQTLTYGELGDQAGRLARRLRAMGVRPDVRVALCVERGPAQVVGLLGILASGGAYAPVEARLPALRLAAILEDLAPQVILCESALADRFASFEIEVALIDQEPDGLAAKSEAAGDPWYADDVVADHLAYVIFTSGSTGRPKGVAVSQGNLLAYAEGVRPRLGLAPGASFASITTLAADLGNTAIFSALLGGGCLALLSERCATDPAALAATFERQPVDALKIVPSHLESLLIGERPAAVLPRRLLVLGGETLRRPLVERLRQVAPATLRVLNHYGPSETTVGVLTHEVDAEGLDPRAASVSLGTPLDGTAAAVVGDALDELPPWVRGELLIAGAGVARGYLGEARRTAARFVPDFFSGAHGGRAYRTGDRVRRLSDGTLQFLGRADSQVKFHGFRVELEALRLALNQHPSVRDSVVRLLRDDAGQAVLVAYYVSPTRLDVGALRALLAERIAEEVLPNHYVQLKRLPLARTGKVAFGSLPDLEAIRAQQRQGAHEPPRTPIEEALTSLWSTVLRGVRVGVRDNFFQLGGHSLIATQLVSRIRRTFAVDLALRDLFDHPTVAQLATWIEKALAGPRFELPAIERRPESSDDPPLSYAQERLWVMHQVDPDSPAYNVPLALRLRGDLDRAALTRSLDAIVARHETLRTCFPAVDGVARLVIEPPSPTPVPSLDLRHLPAAEREAEVARLAAENAAQPFDLGQDSPLRARLLRLAAREHVALLAIHHIACDAWSLALLVQEIGALYQAFSHGRPSPLEPLPIQYADFASWQRRAVEGEALVPQVAYWQRQLHGVPSDTGLPYDFPRGGDRPRVGGSVVRVAPPELASAIESFSRDEGVTLFMTLLAAFGAYLAKLTGRDDLAIGTDIANRNQLETEGLIGFFINNLVLRLRLEDNPSFRELVERVKNVTLGAYAHQDLPFDQLVKALGVRRDADRTPLFDVLFVVQNAGGDALELPNLQLEAVDFEVATSKFDISVFVYQAAGQLAFRWHYRSDLFAAESVHRMAEQLEQVLAQVVLRPNLRLSQLEALTEPAREQRAMDTEQRHASTIKRLRRAPRQAIDLTASEPVTIEPLDPDVALPVLVRPAMDDVDLAEWAAAERTTLDDHLRRHGAVLFRGFGLRAVPDFERVAEALCPGLYSAYGDLPKEKDGEQVYHSTPYPPHKTILFHNESSHTSRWPTKQMFFCVQPSASGGETPLVDCRRVYSELDAAMREPFERLGLLYIRNFVPGIDVSWQQFFGTSDRAEVEARCRSASLEFEWCGDDGLCTRQRCAAVARHPITGESVFFNQIQLHHPYFLDDELRASVLSVFGENAMPRDLRYGDGTPIDDATVEAVEALYWRLAVAKPWQRGDIVLLDNMLVAHARNPFEGARKIVVAMGDMIGPAELAAAAERPHVG